MALKADKGYRKDAAGESLRVVVHMPKDEADAIDGWGIPAGPGKPAVRRLVGGGAAVQSNAPPSHTQPSQPQGPNTSLGERHGRQHNTLPV